MVAETGQKRINVTYIDAISDFGISPINIDSFDQIGTYKCVAFNPSLMRNPIFSEISSLNTTNIKCKI